MWNLWYYPHIYWRLINGEKTGKLFLDWEAGSNQMPRVLFTIYIHDLDEKTMYNISRFDVDRKWTTNLKSKTKMLEIAIQILSVGIEMELTFQDNDPLSQLCGLGSWKCYSVSFPTDAAWLVEYLHRFLFIFWVQLWIMKRMSRGFRDFIKRKAIKSYRCWQSERQNTLGYKSETLTLFLFALTSPDLMNVSSIVYLYFDVI